MIDNKFLKPVKRILMFGVPVVLGIGIYLFMAGSQKPPGQKEVTVNIPTVRVMEIQPITVVPRALGYGTAEPVRTWKAVAQVSGKIIYTHPQLQKGSVIRQGNELLKIDPSEYHINITKTKASIENYKVQIQQLEVEKKNNQKLLELQKTDLKIKRQEAERQRKLYQKKIISKTEYESQLQAFISQEVQVQNILNALNLIPVQLELLQTQLAQAAGDLENAKLKLSYTTITAPFDILVSGINNKASEFVQTGQTILEADDISETEIEAQFVPIAMKPIFMSIRERADQINETTVSIGQALGIRARVRFAGYKEQNFAWEGTFNRPSDTLDTETRTIGLIVSVKNTLGNSGPHKALLLKGAYCEVELTGQEQPDSLVIPRSALHPGNIVYLVAGDRTLRKQKVDISYRVDDLVVVRDGISKGDTLILSDVIPAIEGMKVEPRIDSELVKKLILSARGGRS